MIAIALIVFNCTGCFHHRQHTADCKARADAYNSRVEKLKREAPERLRIGTKREDVVRFFEEIGIPVHFVGGEATGTIKVKGCGPSLFCGDDALIGLRVQVDNAGNVVGKPLIGAIYTNCV